MNYKNVAPLAGVLVLVATLMWPRAGGASPETGNIPQPDSLPVDFTDSPNFSEPVVGDYNLPFKQDNFLPHQRCKVGTGQDVLKLLQDCKSQRKGWLRL